MEIAQLSKTDYIKGLQCSKSLWFFKNRKDLKLSVDKKLESNLSLGMKLMILQENISQMELRQMIIILISKKPFYLPKN